MDGMSVTRAIKADPKLRDVRVVILTSLAYHADETNFRNLGISAYLTKPVKQSRLFDSLATVMNEPPRLVEETGGGQVGSRQNATSAAVPDAGSKNVRILIAEDNAVNQKVALRQLAKLGYSADAVASGVEVLLAIDKVPYDLILMDCQMPEMDGYEATRRIRDRERGSEGRRHRIIAITAHTLDGDRKKCLDAGMDDYLSKPIRFDELARMMDKWTTSSPT
jgi:two-component system sensor histidine kinase/response regulator